MSAFLPQKQIIQIFNKDMFADSSLKELFKELLGISGIKPFECVGTNEEVILAMYKAYLQETHPYKIWELKPIFQLFKDEILNKMTDTDFIALENKLMKIYDKDNIPIKIKKLCNL